MIAIGWRDRPAIVLLAAIVAAAMILTGMRQGFPLVAALPGLRDLGRAGQDTLFALLLFGLLALIAAGGIGRAQWPALPGPRPGAAGGMGLAIGVGGLLATLALATVAGTAQRAAVPGATSILLLFGGTLLTLFQTGVEELYFRGWLQRALAPLWGPVAAIAISALAFAGLHLLGGARQPLSLINLCLGGVLFGLLAQRTGGLAAPVAAHFGWNWMEGIGVGLDPNPGAGPFGALADLDLVGAGAWGGSDEGLNASIAMTIVLLALLLPLLAGYRRAAPMVAVKTG